MNLHWFQHVPFEGLGSIEPWSARAGHRLSVTRFHVNDPLPALDRVDALIVMGGPMNIYEHAQYPWLVAEKQFIGQVIADGKPVLGICLGAQLIADVLGAKVVRNAQKEIGWFPVRKTAAAADSGLFREFPQELEVFHWHGDTFGLPPGAVHVASSAACENQAFVCQERVVGLQFHLETMPANAEQLIAHCGDELVAGPFIQPAESLLAEPARFQKINTAMHKLLDRLLPKVV